MGDLQNQIWFIKAMFHFIPISNFTIKTPFLTETIGLRTKPK